MYRKGRTFVIVVAAAACWPAFAQQSSVAIYGRLDLGLFKQNGGTTPTNGGISPAGPAASMWQLREGSKGRIGFRGIEDLGGGLEAGFQMEHRFDADTGTARTPFWEARSFLYVGAPKSWGTVYLGREYIPAFWSALRIDPWGFDTVASPGQRHLLANYGVPGTGIRSNNTIGWRSAKWGGLTTNIAGTLGEGVQDTGVGANVEYNAGPLLLTAGFDRTNPQQKLWLVGGTYDFGFARPGLLYARSTVNNIENRNLSLTARVPLGIHQVKLSLSRLDPAGANNTNTRASAGYEYFLSKRTSLLANIGSAKQNGFTRTTLTDFTVKHNF